MVGKGTSDDRADTAGYGPTTQWRCIIVWHKQARTIDLHADKTVVQTSFFEWHKVGDNNGRCSGDAAAPETLNGCETESKQEQSRIPQIPTPSCYQMCHSFSRAAQCTPNCHDGQRRQDDNASPEDLYHSKHMSGQSAAYGRRT